MSVRPCQIPQNGVLRRLFRPVRFSIFPAFSRTGASASAPTTSRTTRSRVFGTDFRVSTISAINLSSRLSFEGFMVLPLSRLALYSITSGDTQTVKLRLLWESPFWLAISLAGWLSRVLFPTRRTTSVLKQLRAHARDASSRQGFQRSVLAHDDRLAAPSPATQPGHQQAEARE